MPSSVSIFNQRCTDVIFFFTLSLSLSLSLSLPFLIAVERLTQKENGQDEGRAAAAAATATTTTTIRTTDEKAGAKKWRVQQLLLLAGEQSAFHVVRPGSHRSTGKK